MTKLQANIIELLQQHYSRHEVAERLDCAYATVCKVAKQHADIVKQSQVIEAINPEDYERYTIRKLKKTIMHVANILAEKNIQKESSPQLAKTLAILVDKLRLLQDKPTSITQTNTHHVTPEMKARLKKALERMHEDRRALH